MEKLENPIPLIIRNDVPAFVIEYLYNNKLIEKSWAVNETQFLFISGRLLGMIANDVPIYLMNAPGNENNIINLLKGKVGAYYENLNSENLEIPLRNVNVGGIFPKIIILNNCNVRRLCITAGDSAPKKQVSLIQSNIDLIQSSDFNFDFFEYFDVIKDTEIGAIAHKHGSPPFITEHQSTFSFRDLPIGVIYTDAMIVNLSNIDYSTIILHPQANEAIFQLKSCQFTFNRHLLSKYLKIGKGIIGSLGVSYRKFYFSGFWGHIDEKWADIDLSFQKNAFIAENTLKILQEKSSILQSSESYNRYLYFFNSRNSKIKRLLYWFNGAYYNILIPAITVILSVAAFFLIFWLQKRPPSDIYLLVEPKSLLKDYLFSPIEFSANAIDFGKYTFIAALATFVYSSFCLLLALRRKFGFPNELR